METKEFKISISRNRKYIRIDVFKPVTAELEMNFFHEGVKKMQAHSIKNVLVNVSKVPNITTWFNDFRLAYYETQKVDYPRAGKIAVLVYPDDPSHTIVL